MTAIAQALQTWTCSKCGRILLEWSLTGMGTITLVQRKRCDRCNEWNTYTCQVSLPIAG